MSQPKSTNSFIERRALSLVANEVKSVNIYGRVFYCNSATGPFTMNFNDGEFFPILGRGVEWALVGADFYSRLQFKATQATDLEFYAGNFAYHENVVVPVSKVAQTLVKYNATSQLLLGQHVDLPGTGTPGSGFGYRKHLIVTNFNADPAVYLTLEDSDPAHHQLQGIFGGQTNVYETSDDLRLHAQIGDTVLLIMEIFYPE